jgi:hypothetical protein
MGEQPMKTIELSSFDTTISSEELGETILSEIRSSLKNNSRVSLNFRKIDAITTFCAKQIFGTLYFELGEAGFYDKIGFHDVPEEIQFIITRSIYDSIEDNTKNKD